MKVSISRLFFYSLFLLVISCGSSSSGGGGTGGGGSGGGGGSISLNQLATNFAQYLADANGDEVTASQLASGVTVNFFGFSWCAPSAGFYMTPITATATNNVYGCQNVVSATAVASAMTADFTVTLPYVYFDGTVNGKDVYMDSSAPDTLVTVAAAIINNGDGTFSLDATVMPTVMTTPGTVSADSNDPVTKSALVTLQQTDLDTIYTGVMEEIMVAELMSFASTAASFVIP